MKLLKFLLTVLGCLGVLGMGIKKGDGELPTSKHPYQEFVSRVGQFPYTASEAKKQSIVTNYGRLVPGLAREQELQILGEPDIETLLYTKYARTRAKGFLGWSWTYFLFKLEPSGENLRQDKTVHVFFDTQGCLQWVVPRNIEGLEEMGSPSPQM